jgi:hypothetical protein
MSVAGNGKEDAKRPDVAGKTITVDVTSQTGMILVSGTDDMESVAEIGKSMGNLFDAIAEAHGLPSGYALGPINRMCDGGCEATSEGPELPTDWVHIDGLDYCATCRQTVESPSARPDGASRPTPKEAGS